MSHAKQNTPAKKPTVAQTCNQLSSFLKNKVSLKDLHLGFNPIADNTGMMTIDLLSNINNPEQVINEQPEKLKAQEEPVNVKESKGSQMTIFYDGQVIVIDDITEDKARDLMLKAGAKPKADAAATGDYSNGKTISETTTRVELVSNKTNSSNVQLQANGLDLPIARRASLHKFLAKRKDRATVRAPYQLHDPASSSGAGSSKHERNFDLNL